MLAILCSYTPTLQPNMSITLDSFFSIFPSQTVQPSQSAACCQFRWKGVGHGIHRQFMPTSSYPQAKAVSIQWPMAPEHTQPAQSAAKQHAHLPKRPSYLALQRRSCWQHQALVAHASLQQELSRSGAGVRHVCARSRQPGHQRRGQRA